MTIFIMASGEQTRFGPSGYKQMLEIAGESLIGRMARQAQERGTAKQDIVLITHHMPLELLATAIGIRAFNLGSGRGEHLAGSMATVAGLWPQTPIIILLGDVFYSDAVMDRVFSEPRPLRFFGNQWELFAAVVRPSSHVAFLSACQQVAANPPPGGGKMRKVYQDLAGLPTDGSVLEPAVEDYLQLIGWGRPNVAYPDGALLSYVGDETRDFDRLEDYEKFVGVEASDAQEPARAR